MAEYNTWKIDGRDGNSEELRSRNYHRDAVGYTIRRFKSENPSQSLESSLYPQYWGTGRTIGNFKGDSAFSDSHKFLAQLNKLEGRRLSKPENREGNVTSFGLVGDESPANLAAPERFYYLVEPILPERR